MPQIFRGLSPVLENALGRVAEKRLVDIQPGDVPATYADIDALANDVGFKPSTPIEVGVKRFVDWYRSFYSVPGAGVPEASGQQPESALHVCDRWLVRSATSETFV